MKKYTLLLIVLFSFIYTGLSVAQTTLGVRDVAVIKLQTDTPDSFTFITFVDLDPGTVIYFSSIGINTSGVFELGNTNVNDGTFAYTVPAGGHDAGDIFTWTIATGSPNFSVYTDSISTRTTERNFSSSGDSLTVFQKTGSPGGGPEALSSPSFISITYNTSTQFGGADPTDTNESNLPSGLSTTAPVSALALGAGPTNEDEFDDTVYAGGYTFGTVEAAKDSFFNVANYVRVDSIFDTNYENAVNNIPTSANIAVPPTPAVINSVTVPSAGTYVAGGNLTFSVNFDKAVNVNLAGGTPGLALTIGATNVSANYISGSGTATLSFSYNIQNGDEDTNGISINSLQLNNGTIQGGDGLDANLTLNGVGNTTGVLVDAIAPALQSVTRQSPMTSPTDADQVTLRYTFTEAVTGVQSGNFFSNNPAAISTIISTPVSPTVYDVQFSGPNLAEFNGTIFFSMVTNGIADAAGNAMSSTNVIGTNDNNFEFINVYFIGGTVSGLLEGNFLVLKNDQNDEEIITMDGAYAFPSSYANNDSYTVTIDLQPIDPIQPCDLTNGSATINAADVTDINVTCEVGTDLIYRDGFEQ